ncbi:MAG TPA: DNA ligase [Kofleriaceae bacterium]
MPKETPWWKKTPEAAPDAPRATRPAEDEPEDAEGEDDEGGDAEGGDDGAPEAASGPRDLADGESTTVQGSGANPYVLKNVGGVYSCTCPAWRNAGGAIDKRTCKHLRALRGDLAETARVGVAAASTARASAPRSGVVASSGTAGAAPPILLAHPWDHATDLTGWWMSEKLDGVRAYWDGTRLISRLGNEFYAPAWFIAGLPETPLDGELWAGRKKFQRAVSIARRQDRGDAWRELSYVVFDAPSHDGTFEERLAHAKDVLAASGNAHSRTLEHERCTGLEHLRGELARVEALGGEGLMMRQPSSKYEIGRSWTLRKVKTFHDAEARVTAHVRGTGKHSGRLGSLQCQMPNGTTFNVGTGLSDDERNNPPPVGAIITYRYQELSNDGVPRFPSYVGVRDDVAWPPAGSTPVAPVARAASAARAPVADPPRATPVAPIASERPCRKFARGDDRWSVELDGRNVLIRESSSGDVESSTTRRNANASAAWRDAERQIAEKITAGFTEIIS